MHYDPIKRQLGNVFNRTPWLRIVFYRLLDLLLLRAWHVHRVLRSWWQTHRGDVRVLDAGMGFGQYTYFIHRHFPNWKIDAVDVKEEQVEDCRRFFDSIKAYDRVTFSVADLTQYVHPVAYDLALSVDVMEHILEDVRVFQNIHKSLKPGGMLLISTPSDQGGSDVQADGETSFIEEHVRDGYNIKEIEDKLLRAGFSKIDARYSYGAPGKISWRLTMKWPIMMLGVSRLFFLVLPFYYVLVYPFAYVLNYLDSVRNHPTGTGLIVSAWK
jgi:SAM-dependent methyltransferase